MQSFSPKILCRDWKKLVEYTNNANLARKNLKTVGWGLIYDETKVGDNYLTSCMTDQNGPPPFNYRPCIFSSKKKHEHTEEVTRKIDFTEPATQTLNPGAPSGNFEPPEERTTKSGCDKETPPPGYESKKGFFGKTKWKKCQEYWIKAKDELDKLEFTPEFLRVSAIVIDERRNEKDEVEARIREIKNEAKAKTIQNSWKKYETTAPITICPNPDFLKQRGWCEIKGSTKENKKWGICSTSCSQYNKYRGEPIKPSGVYHEMNLKLSNNLFTFKLDSRGFKNSALIESVPIYPFQKNWIFERSKRDTLHNSQGPVKTDIPPYENIHFLGNAFCIYDLKYIGNNLYSLKPVNSKQQK